MQYREDQKSGNKISTLGYGCMRLPKKLGIIDINKSKKLILNAYNKGVNYYDTAYLYPGSEETIGQIFEELEIRKNIYIATKLPQSSCKIASDFDKYFNVQKRRLRTDYIDYYLMHNISSFSQWENLMSLGIQDWIASKKQSGEIRQIGFSFHGTQQEFFSMLETYEWDFVQIQYNYININYQAGELGLKKAAEMNIPVIIMEPLLGGKLANNLPQEAIKIMHHAKKDSTPAEWALRWLWDQPEVMMLLSGMNEQIQLDENIAIADEAYPNTFSDDEKQVIKKVIEVFNKSDKVHCTGCNYCLPCPQNINIPACFTSYNASYAVGWMAAEMQYIVATGGMGEYPRFASSCINCGKCEKKCPQNIEIRKNLKKVKRRFEIPGIKTALKIARKVTR